MLYEGLVAQIDTRFGIVKQGSPVFISAQLLELVVEFEGMHFLMADLLKNGVSVRSSTLFQHESFIILEEEEN